MDRDILQHLPVIEAIARRGGFGAAAAHLGMSSSAVSNAVRVVETRLGHPLFARTTRRVHLTEAGARLLERIGPALTAIDEGLEGLRGSADKPAGLLRINTPRVAVAMVLAPIIADMATAFPNVRIELIVEDALVDIVAHGHDAGVRLGEMIAADMVAVRLTPPFSAIMCASPSYIALAGRPDSLDALADHNLIALRFSPLRATYDWDVRSGDRDITIETRGTTIAPDPICARELALAGTGIAYLFEPLVRADLDAGRLVQLLPDAAIEEPGLFLYFPRRASLAPKLRAFIDTARRHFRKFGDAARRSVATDETGLAP